MNKLDEEFKQITDQINNKLREATIALREANRLAEKAGLPSLIYTQWTSDDDDSLDDLNDEDRQELEDNGWDGESSPLKMKIEMIDVSALETEIQIGGWSTSSSYC